MAKDLVSVAESLRARHIDILRVVYPDVLGLTRSKDMMVSQLERSAQHGPAFCQGVWVTTTEGGVLEAGRIAEDGLQDLVTEIDPNTIRDLPWEPGLAYVVADANNPDGSPNMFSPRTVVKTLMAEYKKHGLVPVVGPELEFYIARATEDGGWARDHEVTGHVYTTGSTVDPDGTFLRLIRHLDKMNIGVFAGNHEFSPSQYEINFWHSEALDAADRTFLFKTATKDIVAKEGKVATFMGKPWSDEGGSGFHLHFSVTDESGKNVMHDGKGNFSELGMQVIAGITRNAHSLTALTNPSVNAFKRLGPDTLAPYRANWGYDNRSAMVRIPPEGGEGTRLEVRVGDGMANPYLVVAGLLAAGLDGIERKLEAPAPVEGMAYDNDNDPILPMSFTEALDALEANDNLRKYMSPLLIEAFIVLKRDEIARYQEAVKDHSNEVVTAWEQKEYLAHF
jgi:glutamine synthetase